MTSLARTRTRSFGSSIRGSRITRTYNGAGTLTSTSTTLTSATWNRGQESNGDSITLTSPYEDHSLDIVRSRLVKQGLANGFYQVPQNPLPGQTKQVIELSSWSVLSTGHSNSTSTLPTVDWSYWTTQAIADANPNSPALDLPLFLFELREFPRMLRDLGRVLERKLKPSDVPGGYLAYKFGWAPLIKDAISLMSLSQEISRRIEFLNESKRKERYSRTLNDSTVQNYVAPADLLIQSATSPTRSLTVRRRTEYRHKVWYSARLEMDDADRAELLALLRDDGPARTFFLLGLSHVSASTLWNALPWSWLSDYLVNVGDFLEAGSGAIRFQLRDFNIMSHQRIAETTDEVVRNNLGSVAWQPHLSVVEAKRRRVSSAPSPRLALRPFLTGGMQANLVALVTAGALRGVGR